MRSLGVLLPKRLEKLLGDITMEYEKYLHHGVDVHVRSGLKGKHREHCLCYGCRKFNLKDKEANCPIARAVFANCVEFNIVTPVWECPHFYSSGKRIS